MAHSPELHSQVRALAYRLAAGLISWAEYRERRAGMVEAIVRGEQALSYGPAEVFEDSTAPKEHELSQVLIDLDEIDPPPRRWPAIAAVAALGVVIMVSGWAVWRSLQPPVVASAPVVELAAGESVLHHFLNGGDWSAEALDGTAAEWASLEEPERDAARTTATWRRLQQQLRDQTNRQRVLVSVDDSGEAASQLERLEAFARRLAD